MTAEANDARKNSGHGHVVQGPPSRSRRLVPWPNERRTPVGIGFGRTNRFGSLGSTRQPIVSYVATTVFVTRVRATGPCESPSGSSIAFFLPPRKKPPPPAHLFADAPPARTTYTRRRRRRARETDMSHTRARAPGGRIPTPDVGP